MSTAEHARDVAAIEQLVAAAERFQSDGERFAELLTDDYAVPVIA